MNHRIVSAVVATIVALFAIAGGLFAASLAVVTPGGVTLLRAPNDPHPPVRRTQDCRGCHRVERNTLPVTHRAYTDASCPRCHKTAVPVLAPHSIAMGDVRCPLCHSDPVRDHGMPANHLRYKTDECLLCHPVDSDHYNRKPEPAGLAAIPAGDVPHPVDGYLRQCRYCHQEGARGSLPASHRLFETETCADCHQVAEGVKPLE